MGNRNDRLIPGPGGIGFRCDWEYSRSLHLCDVFPHTGRWLLCRALEQWPLNADAEVPPVRGALPCVSFIIGHRGQDRVPQLLMTLRSVLQQTKAGVECIVVDQDPKPMIRDMLPDGVRYIHAPLNGGGLAFNRSAAFNAGAALATGEVLILHDGDLLVPAGYVAEVWRLYRDGYEIMQMKRFVFYLDQTSTEHVLEAGFEPRLVRVERVIENAEAGGSVAVSASAYGEVGGMDEDFVGWGGEDNEFWDRCQTRKVWNYGYLPFVHLWHSSKADRTTDNPALALLDRKRALASEDRIRALRARRLSTHASGGLAGDHAR